MRKNLNFIKLILNSLKMKNSSKGITLLEMLIVLMIIFILFSFLVPNYTGVIEEKNICQAEAGVEILKTAIDNYFRHNHSYPSSLNCLTQTQPKIIDVIPQDPYGTDGKNFSYETGVYGPGNQYTYFVVYSRGPDETKTWTFSNGEIHKGEGDDIVASNLPVLR